MKNKLLLIITGYFLIMVIGLISCEKCGPFPNKYKVVGIDWNLYSAVYSNNTEDKLILSEIINDTIYYNLYSIFITPRTETYYAMFQRNNTLGLINSAYACSPVIPTTDDRIDSILIISDKDFDSTHLAGADLSELFDIVVIDQTNNIYYEKFKLYDYTSTKPYVPNEMTLILNSPPSLISNFEFTIKYYQDGIYKDYFEFKTNSIVIKN